MPPPCFPAGGGLRFSEGRRGAGDKRGPAFPPESPRSRPFRLRRFRSRASQFLDHRPQHPGGDARHWGPVVVDRVGAALRSREVAQAAQDQVGYLVGPRDVGQRGRLHIGAARLPHPEYPFAVVGVAQKDGTGYLSPDAEGAVQVPHYVSHIIHVLDGVVYAYGQDHETVD